MNLQQLSSHTVDLDLLPESPTVLDVGCRDFGFTLAILEHRPKARVIAMDPDPEMSLERLPVEAIFLRRALVGDIRQLSNYAGWSTGEGNILCDVAPHYAERTHWVMCVNLENLMIEHYPEAKHFDLVKLDCEGTEYEILEHWPGPVATQISVEFHDWTGPWKEYAASGYYERLWAGPLHDYEVVQHELSPVGPGQHMGHWDSLLRLRK